MDGAYCRKASGDFFPEENWPVVFYVGPYFGARSSCFQRADDFQVRGHEFKERCEEEEIELKQLEGRVRM